MDYQTATQLQNLLTEAYLVRPRNLAFSFALGPNEKVDALTNDHRNVIGISSLKRTDNTFALRLFTTLPEPVFNRTALAQQLAVSVDDLELVITDGIYALNAPIQTRVRPVPIGCSIGHPLVSAGTFGSLVKDDQHTYILSNNHVLANTNQATPGDNILQPGALDGGQQPADAIARLSRFAPINFTGVNKADAAIAEINDLGSIINSFPASVPPIGIIQGVTTPTIGMDVVKYGRTTGFTEGTIVSVNSSISAIYGGNSAFFDDQLEIAGKQGPFAMPGDSGSVVIDLQSKRAVGLLFSGTPGGNIFANPISNVLQLLNVSFV